ncbi:MAG TPA: ATP synthase F1 subunit delta [Chitinophagaceae bacterium]|nr:ATP synthase F1 subunit delta [Chitinophagaceae bacterium]
MPNPRLASRYAKSLLGLSIEQDRLEKVYEDMLWLQQVCKGSREFVNVLKSPIIKADKKEKIVAAVTEGHVSELTAAFNRLLIAKGRESYLPEVITSFISQYKVHKNIHTVKLTTAGPISDSLRSAIIEQVRKTSGYQQIELEEKEDKSLIGGFVLQIGDKLVDASVLYDLKQIERQFENNDFVYKIR